MSHQQSIACGFIGLGSQGAPIARRMLDAEYRVNLWARRAQALEAFRQTSARFAPTIEDLGARSDHVGICVLDDAAVREVCDRLIPVMRPGTRLAVHSTTLPSTCKDVARSAAARDVLFIEAPVSGGAPAASVGELTIMMGGSVEAIEAARPVFATFASLMLHVGEVGTAQAAKLINNTLMAANLGLAHCAASIGDELGIAKDVLVTLLKASSGRSFALDVYARHRDRTFANGAQLLGKVELLGEVVDPAQPAFKILRDAALSLTSNEI